MNPSLLLLLLWTVILDFGTSPSLKFLNGSITGLVNLRVKISYSHNNSNIVLMYNVLYFNNSSVIAAL